MTRLPSWIPISLSAVVLVLAAGCTLDEALSLDRSGGVAPPGLFTDDGQIPEEAKKGGFIDTRVENTSTFGADVDTGSYTLTRRHLMEGTLPDPTSVRTEEFINYFKYGYPEPAAGDGPFSVALEGAPSPFGNGLQLLRIGLKAREVPVEQRLPVNLVFLIDVSGSMHGSDRLGLVKYALGHLVRKLQPSDTLGIVVYAGEDAVLLEPTAVEDKARVLDAIEQLGAGGSTAGEAGIRRAYELAEQARRADGVNRVVLCTDGDFNVGATGNELVSIIESFRDKGIFLTTLGFGMGNYQDGTLEQLADHGNGNYAYIDSPNEALRVLGENLVGTLQVVAKDVKVQVAFNAEAVARYRLIGYENRRLANEDFANDAVDSGDIGAGHYVTALYEVELREGNVDANLADVRLRYKEPEGDTSTEFTRALERAAVAGTFDTASADLRYAAAVAEFAEILALSPFSEGARFDDVAAIAQGVSPEFPELVAKAKALWK
ncbi:MAG: von Willebrand factor type A domain-containing protein [Myxococcaceae bacterium]